MNYREFKRDIFEHLDTLKDSPDRVILLHTISGDCRMGAGIAQKIEDKFHWRTAVIENEAYTQEAVIKTMEGPWTWDKKRDGWTNPYGDKLEFNWPIGSIVVAHEWFREGVEDPTCAWLDIWGLVTKERYWQKPTIQDMDEALKDLSRVLSWNEKPITLVMPTIGCGLDRLDWPEVSALIHKHLGDIPNLTVEVCMF